MICLGIETTAHTLGVGIVKDTGEILANINSQYTTEEGGIIPNKAAEHHIEQSEKLVKKALETAKIKLEEVDIIAFSQGPGMGHCLRIGTMMARSLSLQNKKPIIGVNHCIAHLEIGKLLTEAKNPLLLYTSGANTQIIAHHKGKYRIFGETLDIGVGNFLDTIARELKIGFPGGPKIEQLAKEGKYLDIIPYTVKGMDITFSGIQTQLIRQIQTNQYSKEDICKTTQETVFAMITEITERAIAYTELNEIVLGGGVACNKKLQDMLQQMCDDRNIKMYVPEKQYLLDNAAMIAWLGILEYSKNPNMKMEETEIKPYWRSEDV